jgi:predicted secreted acid phosphatase
MRVGNCIVLVGVLMAIAPAGWAQDNPATSNAPAEQSHNDSIVRMRQQEATANRVYKQKVAAAKKVYDQKKAEAKKERDTAIATARYGAGQ